MGHALPRLPRSAAWQHLGARSGFETVFCTRQHDALRISGCTTAVEDGLAWAVGYEIHLDAEGRVRRCAVRNRTDVGTASTVLETDGSGRWWVDGVVVSAFDGCLDVDLESSVVTNAFPVHRLALPVSARADAPAVFVRAVDLAVERLEQSYRRVGDDGLRQRYDYAAPVFDVACRLVYDEAGLLLDYPGLAARIS